MLYTYINRHAGTQVYGVGLGTCVVLEPSADCKIEPNPTMSYVRAGRSALPRGGPPMPSVSSIRQQREVLSYAASLLLKTTVIDAEMSFHFRSPRSGRGGGECKWPALDHEHYEGYSIRCLKNRAYLHLQRKSMQSFAPAFVVARSQTSSPSPSP